jgi:hypothetical protein
LGFADVVLWLKAAGIELLLFVLELVRVSFFVLGDFDDKPVLSETQTLNFLPKDLHDGGLGMQFVHVMRSEVEVCLEITNKEIHSLLILL